MWKRALQSNHDFFSADVEEGAAVQARIFFSRCGRGRCFPIPKLFSADWEEGAVVQSLKFFRADIKEGAAVLFKFVSADFEEDAAILTFFFRECGRRHCCLIPCGRECCCPIPKYFLEDVEEGAAV